MASSGAEKQKYDWMEMCAGLVDLKNIGFGFLIRCSYREGGKERKGDGQADGWCGTRRRENED